jgi:hypothetical protein
MCMGVEGAPLLHKSRDTVKSTTDQTGCHVGCIHQATAFLISILWRRTIPQMRGEQVPMPPGLKNTSNFKSLSMQCRLTHQTYKKTVHSQQTTDSPLFADRNPTDHNGNGCYRTDTNNAFGIATDSTMDSTPTEAQNRHAIDQPAYQTLTDLVTHSCVQCARQPARYGTRSCLQIIVVTRPRTRRQSLSPALCRLLCRTTGTRPLPCGRRLVKAAGGWNAIFGET